MVSPRVLTPNGAGSTPVPEGTSAARRTFAYNYRVGDRDGERFFYAGFRGGDTRAGLRRGAEGLRADTGAARAPGTAEHLGSARSPERRGGSKPHARRRGAGQGLGGAPLRGAAAVHADAATHAQHPPRLRYEPAHRDGDHRLLSAPTPGCSAPPRPQAADAPELPRRLR